MYRNNTKISKLWRVLEEKRHISLHLVEELRILEYIIYISWPGNDAAPQQPGTEGNEYVFAYHVIK